jgi:hypothetical protein
LFSAGATEVHMRGARMLADIGVRGCDLHLPRDGPEEAHELAGNRGDRHDLGLAACEQPPVPGAEPDLRFPGNLADSLGLGLDPVVQGSADRKPARVNIFPGCARLIFGL